MTMPISTHRAVLIILPGPPNRVAALELDCMQMASDLVTQANDPDYEQLQTLV